MTNQASKTNLIPPHGGYRKLKSFQLASLSHDWTVEFCRRFVDNRNRENWNRTNLSNQTNRTDLSYRWNRQADQMIQAARSGTQNIAEGSQASGTSKKTELKLVNVARASLEELLLDFQDFLRQRKLKLWKKDDAEALKARNFLKNLDLSNLSNSSDPQICLSDQTLSDAERFANLMICLIHQANFLLDRQLQTLEKDFLEQGGFTERLFNARSAFRSNQTNQTYQKTKQFLIILFFLFGLFAFTSSASAADRFWVGGTGNWSDDDNHWATSSGGAPANGNVPTSADNVFFDSEANHLGGDVAYIVTVDVAANCLDITFARSGDPSTGGLPTLTMSAAVRVYGNLSLVSGMTVTSPGGYAVQFGGASGSGTVTTNGVTMGCAVQFGYSGPGKTWTLVDSLTLSTWSIDFIAGTLDTANQTVTTVSFANSLNSLTRTLTLGSSTLNISGNFDFSGTNQTLTANTATINMTGAGKYFSGVSSMTWGGTVNFTGSGAHYIERGTFNNLNVQGTANKTDKFYIATGDVTITGTLTFAGNSATNRLLVYTAVPGTARTITSNGTNTFSNVDFQDITGAGTANWDLSAITGNSGDAGGNSGITFTTAQTQYWHVGTGNWSDSSKWFTATNGSGAGRVPLPQDDVVFDASSTDGASTITVDMPRLGKDLNFSAVNDATTVNFGTTVANSIFGSLTLGSSITPGGMNYSTTFENRAPSIITSAGKTFTSKIGINTPGTSVTLADNFIVNRSVSNALELVQGTFNAGGNNVTSWSFGSNNNNTRTLIMGGGTWTITCTSNDSAWLVSSTLLLTSTGNTLILTGNSSNNRTFNAGGLTYNIVKFTNTGTGVYIVTGANTANYQFEPNAKVQFPSGVTQTVTGFSGNGTAGNLVTITSSTPGSPATLSKASGNVNVDYFSIKDSNATGGANWWAGTNSTLVSGNSGWVLGNSPGVFYSVGQSAADLKTGGPSVSIASGVATFSVAQVGNIGVGDRVTFNTNVKAYISGKTSSTVWNVVTATGGRPADITNSTVVSILREYTSLSAAEAGATDSNHLNTSDLVAGNYQLNFPCYYDTGADTTAVTVDGWTTGANNYIKIYTPNNTTTEANVSQRHSGKWDDGKYIIAASPADYSGVIINISSYTRIEGLQINYTGGAGTYRAGIFNNATYSKTSNNVVKNSGSGTPLGIILWNADYANVVNNIVYDFDINFMLYDLNPVGAVIYNNSFIDAVTYGIRIRGVDTGSHSWKNNLVQGSRANWSLVYNFGTYITANNLTEDATGPDASYINKIATFADEVNSDFHLSLNDTVAKNMGADLSADANLAVTNDIDGQGRLAASGGFDIGADEAVTPIFYSVGQNTTDHKTGSPTVTIASGVATFSVAQTATNMGVGDKITYNVSSIMYISGKISETTWNVVTATGQTTPAASGQAVNSIAHAFASLSLAEAGASGASYLNTSDLVAGNYQLNFPCYYDTGADTTAVQINGWTTGASNYIKIYTPNNTSTEANVSQRHSGKWDDGKYNLSWNSGYQEYGWLLVSNRNVIIDGLQVKDGQTTYGQSLINFKNASITSGFVKISNNIVRGNINNANVQTGINDDDNINSNVQSYIYNNVVYDEGGYGIYSLAYKLGGVPGKAVIYNNTLYNNGRVNGYYNIRVQNSATGRLCALINNLAYTAIGSSDYTPVLPDVYVNNISKDATSPNSGSTDCGGHSCRNQTVSFVDAANFDFHLSLTDIGARDAGANLYADAYLPITDDIDGNLRPNGTNFDIGADEADNSSQKIKGTIKLKGQVKFR